MPKDKYTATWVSHSSISDFLACPRAYFLKNVYKDPTTGRKIRIASPPLSLGQIVHEVIEELSTTPVEKRFAVPLVYTFHEKWEKVSGKKGGFINKDTEHVYKIRGEEMLKRVTQHPGPLKNKAVKIQMELPYYWLSEQDNLILCGKIDWLEYLEELDSVHIIDFKTGKNEERADSLQLPIYVLLTENTQSRDVHKASYWYLEHSNEPIQQQLPDMNEAQKDILKIAKDIRLARALKKFECPHGGCHACNPYETIVRGDAEKVGVSEFNDDLYILTTDQETSTLEEELPF